MCNIELNNSSSTNKSNVLNVEIIVDIILMQEKKVKYSRAKL